jgi:branched chain amino acid efflux pump
MTWLAVLLASAGVYAIKLAGLSVPERVLENARVRRVADLLPVALLAALALTQTVTSGHELVLDARLAGLGAAVVAIALRAPFLVVVGAAALTAALLRVVA